MVAKNKRINETADPLRRISELVSGLTGTEVPRKGLRVRVPCPPLSEKTSQSRLFCEVFS